MARHHPERFTEDPDRYGDARAVEAGVDPGDAGAEQAPAGADSDQRDPELRDLSDDELLIRLTAYLGETEPLHGLATSVATVAAAETAASSYRTLEAVERAGREAELERVREWLERRGFGRAKQAGKNDSAAEQVDTTQAPR